jgi:hypothetical protein
MALGEFFSQFRSLLFGSEDLLRNRRHQPRLALDLGVVISLDGRTYPAQVKDFGPNGLRLQGPFKAARGRRLEVQVMPDSGLDGATRLVCRVAWCKAADTGHQVGCSYDDKPEVLAASWVQMLLRERHQRSTERRDRRVEAAIPARVLDPGQEPLDVFVLDLSLGGARVFSPQPWNPSSQPRLSLRVPGQSSSVDFAVEVIEGRAQDASGYNYRLRFRDPDSKRQALLRRMLMQLLEGVRKAGRSRPNDLIPEQAPSSKPGPAGKLGAAVRNPNAPAKRSKGVSKYLQAPDLPPPKAAPAAAPALASPAPVESLPTGRLRQPVPSRWQNSLLPQDRRLRARGWLVAALQGWFVQGEMVSDQLARPTRDFWRCLGPLIPMSGLCWGPVSWTCPSDSERGFSLGPGLLWADRQVLLRLHLAQRGPLQWWEQTLRIREKLERRTSNLRQRAYQMLALLGCGGPASVRQILVTSQLVAAIARYCQMDDPLRLNQLRLAALLKDVGEALLFVGSQPRSVRDRYALHLNALEFGEPELAELGSDWSGFGCPSELWIQQLRVEQMVLEYLPGHPGVADRLLHRLGFPLEVRSAIRYHHENWNGSGYPEGLVEHEIPWEARCLAVADGFASALCQQPNAEHAYQAVAAFQGTAYDPSLVRALLGYLQEMKVVS